MTSQYASTRGKSQTNGLAVAGLTCGIIGVFFFQFILGPLAIIFGAVGRRNSSKGRGMATAAIVLGVIDVLLFVVLMVVASQSGGFTWYVGG
ncbi:DUF4190 domain-containing protein [Streptomyces sp. YC504]|uniref:DUF4190 domain-containing protein n=1 Tax=Streptomyces mesophilus TaxID=1775132 RepID=A0A6G4XTH5_9ACTN|nr:DUF4190 domain-containing protein [Streptomyces mesophilus]NGO80502.1 DUF4190 domain-containing protein [Streptomyces mesophilus]